MAVHKKYQYTVLRGNTHDPDIRSDESLEAEMNRLGELGWRHVATIQNGPTTTTRVIMELETIKTDEGLHGAFQKAELKVKGKK